MGDWMISKKRYWGLALPIWVCAKCNAFEVIGSRKELKERAVAGWKEFEGHTPHRPWIDLVKIRCGQCGGRRAASRTSAIPGSTPASCRTRLWGTTATALTGRNGSRPTFITESLPGQFRNWFYALLAMSTMMANRTPFKVLLGHALVRDEKGEEMHKSTGQCDSLRGSGGEDERRSDALDVLPAESGQ